MIGPLTSEQGKNSDALTLPLCFAGRSLKKGQETLQVDREKLSYVSKKLSFEEPLENYEGLERVDAAQARGKKKDLVVLRHGSDPEKDVCLFRGDDSFSWLKAFAEKLTKPLLSAGVDRQWIKRHVDDYGQPLFELLREQKITGIPSVCAQPDFCEGIEDAEQSLFLIKGTDYNAFWLFLFMGTVAVFQGGQAIIGEAEIWHYFLLIVCVLWSLRSLYKLLTRQEIILKAKEIVVRRRCLFFTTKGQGTALENLHDMWVSHNALFGGVVLRAPNATLLAFSPVGSHLKADQKIELCRYLYFRFKQLA